MLTLIPPEEIEAADHPISHLEIKFCLNFNELQRITPSNLYPHEIARWNPGANAALANAFPDRSPNLSKVLEAEVRGIR